MSNTSYPNVTRQDLELTPMQVFFTPPANPYVDCTTAVASPGVVHAVAHGLVAGDPVKFATTGSLPTGLVAGTTYYVISSGLTADDFEVSATIGGSAINFTGSTSGQSSFQLIPVEIDLGGTHSGAKITMKYMKADITVDQFGKTVIDRRVNGVEVSIATELAEIKNFDRWKIALPHITRLVTGGDAVVMATQVGDSDSANAGLLRLHPQSEPANILDFDYNFFQAVASAESETSYDPSKQSTLKIVWNVLPDFTTTPAQFFRYGSLSAT